ncbi:MAG: hypothetical protein HQK51_19080, partial [Oligoflexia bacterium]|nr:hypothetical protein [Oligoflexia bacterium]
MKKIILSSLIISFLFPLTLFALENSTPEQGLHFVHLKAKNLEERSQIANVIPIDQVIENSVYSLINDNDYGQLKKSLSHLLFESHFLTFN